MPPADIDDLFREQLDGHASPPGKALWARLVAAAGTGREAPAERLDQLFQKSLLGHATAPPRKLWERLEEEHLRPRRTRPVAWWPLALVATVALLLVAGGAGLWLSSPFQQISKPPLAGYRISRQLTTRPPKLAAAARRGPQIDATRGRDQIVARARGVAASSTGRQELISPVGSPKNEVAQATIARALSSDAAKARKATPGRASRQSNASASFLPAATHRPARTPLTDSPRPMSTPVAATTPGTPPAAELMPAQPTSVPAPETTTGLITVEVRNGEAPAALIAAAPPRQELPAAPRRLGGRLLQQAAHLLRGERLNLAEATGLPENVTVRATVGGHNLTKLIQL
ncbi:MAG: hypothetical protein NVS3B25_00860 [Hymenobacter sp.]